MDIQTPIIFADGTNTFDKLKSEYLVHERGLFILASSGSGKSHYVSSQEAKHWIDGDVFWPLTGADPLHDEWEDDFEVVMEVNSRCDVMTYQAKKQGLWIIGSSNNWLRPDAVVILEKDKQRKFIQSRQKNNYDGGATEEDFENVQRHNSFIRQWVDRGVPLFSKIDEATSYFESQL